MLDEPPSIDAHEVTDKGSINQGAVLRQRAHLVEALYTEPYAPLVLVAAPGSRAKRLVSPGQERYMRGNSFITRAKSWVASV